MSFRSTVTMQAPFSMSSASVNHFERDATKSIGTRFSPAPAGTTALIRRLPLNTSEESLRLMTVFSKEQVDIQVLSPEDSDDAGFRSAILRFETPAGALEAKNILDGKSNISNDAKMLVQILSSSPATGGKRYMDSSASGGPPMATSSTNSSTTSSRQPTRFHGQFQSLDNISPTMNVGPYGSADMPSTELSHYHGIFSSQSPIGNHLADQRPRMSGKKLINDSVDDDETGELLKDPVAYAENGSMGLQRRATAPQLPIHSRLAGLSLNQPQTAGPSGMSSYVHSSVPSLPSHSVSPTVIGGGGPNMAYTQHYRHHFPPANPADQNPPCNTLYVGNLPIDTSEEELKAMFSKQRGYKRLCFRTKQNGPMCFVEFEDVSAATKALTELYGHPLHNSVKGGIRLSFSKNPLGVRSGQTPAQSGSGTVSNMNGMISGPGGAYTTANGPPPGLSVPPGLGLGRTAYSTPHLATGGNSHYGPAFSNPNHAWNAFNGGMMAAGGPMASATSAYPPHMVGR